MKNAVSVVACVIVRKTGERDRVVHLRWDSVGQAFLPYRERVKLARGDAGGNLAERKRVQILRAMVEQQGAADHDEAVDWREN